MTKKVSVAEVPSRCGNQAESIGTEVLVPQTFNFMGTDVRVLVKGSDLWFVAKDVSDALEYRDANLAVRILDDDERGTHLVCTPSGNQLMNIITEAGLYHLFVSSHKTKAKPFRRWVTHEVLPAINRTGTYSREPVKLLDLHGAPKEIAESVILKHRYSYLLDRLGEMNKTHEHLAEYNGVLAKTIRQTETRIAELERSVARVDKIFGGQIEHIGKEQIPEIDQTKQIKAIILVVD